MISGADRAEGLAGWMQGTTIASSHVSKELTHNNATVLCAISPPRWSRRQGASNSVAPGGCEWRDGLKVTRENLQPSRTPSKRATSQVRISSRCPAGCRDHYNPAFSPKFRVHRHT